MLYRSGLIAYGGSFIHDVKSDTPEEAFDHNDAYPTRKPAYCGFAAGDRVRLRLHLDTFTVHFAVYRMQKRYDTLIAEAPEAEEAAFEKQFVASLAPPPAPSPLPAPTPFPEMTVEWNERDARVRHESVIPASKWYRSVANRIDAIGRLALPEAVQNEPVDPAYSFFALCDKSRVRIID